MRTTSVERLALFGGLLAAFGEEKTPRTGESTMTASAQGRRAVALHCVSLGVERRVNPEGVKVVQLSGMRLSVPGARQVSRTGAVAV
ncbi:hypothetical protein ACIOJ9_29250 [Streptomyces sp. NPDC088175]|uniref:hypothetical protein n=1 Tax=unclassified Streptomyces TaxID=2593676 RepID=UPI003807EAA8